MISTKYKDLYISTTKQQLKKLSDLLLYLEKKPNNQNLLENIFRLIHSMKGASATMSYKKTVNLLHAMESLVDKAFSGELRIDNKILNSFFDTLEVLKENFNNIDKKNKELVLTKQTRILKSLLQNKKKDTKTKQRKEKHILGSLPSVAEISISTDKLDSLSHSLDDLLVNSMKTKMKAEGLGDTELLKISVDNDKILSSLRRQIKKLRVVALKDVLSSLPYLAKEIARNNNKKVEVVIKDHDLSLDKSILDELMDILIQLIKNAVSHGISDKQKGKVIIDFSLVGDRMCVSVSDNGQGIDFKEIVALAIKNKIISSQKAKKLTLEEKKALIFYAGISKGKALTTTSGRGIGLSLVKSKVEELEGSIKVETKLKKGTKFIIDLPQPLSVFRSIIFNFLEYSCALPLDHIEKIVDLEDISEFKGLKSFTYKPARQASGKAGRKKKYNLVPILDILAIENFTPMYKYIVLINYQGERLALPVARKIEEDELIMKKEPLVLKNNKYIKGAAISAKGQAILVLDINNLI